MNHTTSTIDSVNKEQFRRNAERFWLQEMSDLPTPLELPLKGSRPMVKRFHRCRREGAIPEKVWLATAQLAAQLEVTHFALLFAGFHLLLSRISGQGDLFVGTKFCFPCHTAQNPGLAECTRPVPIRLAIDTKEPFADFVTHLQRKLQDARTSQFFHLGEIIHKICQKEAPFDFMRALFGCGVDAPNQRQLESYELAVDIIEVGNTPQALFSFDPDLFSTELIDTFLASYLTLLQEIAEKPGAQLGLMQIVTDPAPLFLFNRTSAQSPSPFVLLDQMLLDSLAKNGTKEVCRSKTDSLTAMQLHDNAIELAHILRESGVKPGDLVGICMKRRSQLVTAVLAVWHAGAAYVPLDPSFPTQRISYMIENAKVTFCIVDSDLAGLLPGAIPALCIDSIQLKAHHPAKLPGGHGPNDLAYVLYTSGSTGQPKGVMVHHHAVVNFLQSANLNLLLTADSRILALTTLAFDISVLELNLPLFLGAFVYIADSGEARDGACLASLVESQAIDFMQATPSTWRLLLGAGFQPKGSFTALCGGEPFPPDLAQKLLARCDAVWNGYGPTETTVYVTMAKLHKNDPVITIGRPMVNCQAFVLDENHQLVPPGVKGEIYIGGDCVAHGYINQPELTQERFVDVAWFGGSKLYKTGDIARFLFDGQLESFGRTDAQVKIRGYRIELGEIEKILGAYEGVEAGVALVREDDPLDKRLIAYFSADRPVELNQLRKHMATKLPDYMIPQHFVQLDRLPLLPGGKLNRNALPKPCEAMDIDQSSRFVPQNPNENIFLKIWLDTLNLAEISADDDFFMLGGHSLLAIQMILKINDALSTHLTMNDIFITPVFRDLLAKVDGPLTVSPAKKTIPRGDFHHGQASLHQERMWFIEELYPDTLVHNIPCVWEIHGDFSHEIFTEAWHRLSGRQQIFLTSFVHDGEILRQCIHENTYQPAFVDLSQVKNGLLVCFDLIRKISGEKLPLTAFPLFRCNIYRLAARRHIMFLVVHHAIWDGSCFDIFLRELSSHYQSVLEQREIELPDLPVQYSEFAAWHRHNASTPDVLDQLRHWREQFGSLPEALDIPTDYPRPKLLEHHGITLNFSLTKSQLEKCEFIAQQGKVSLFTLFLATYFFTLHRFSGQTDIVVGVPFRNRDRQCLDNLLGLFINVLPLRINLHKEQSFWALMPQVHQIAMQAMAHGEVLLETIIDALGVKRDDSRTPLYSAMFSYQDVKDRPRKLAHLDLLQVPDFFDASHTDQVLWMEHHGSHLNAGFNFSSALWEPASLENFRECFLTALEQLTINHMLPLEQIDIVSPTARNRILQNFSRADAIQPVASLEQLLDLSRWPKDRVALRVGENQFTYGEIEARSNQLASWLGKKGINAGKTVGVCMNRNEYFIIALIGILKSGAAYIPVTPQYPEKRITFIFHDAKTALILTESDVIDLLPPDLDDPIALDRMDKSLAAEGSGPPAILHDPRNFCYVIYTSGSTGTPKGVAIARMALANFLQAFQATLPLGPTSRILGISTETFDISVLELIGSMAFGASLVLYESELISDAKRLMQVLTKEGISFMQATPSGWRNLVEAGWQGNKDLITLSCGEALSKDLAKELSERSKEVWNGYGPTEATILCTAKKIDSNDRQPISIGRPLPGYRAYVVDDALRLKPLGVWGNLYIGGVSAENCYIHNSELTRRRFVQNPYLPGELFYHTGDIARMRPDGEIEYLGRSDNQVKVRGFRIELGEIEAILSKHPAIAEALVIIREDVPHDKRIVAYVVARGAAKPSGADIHDFLSQHLPRYMLPNHLVYLDQIPLSSSNKVNRALLPSPSSEAKARCGKPPGTHAEKIVATIWQDLLHIEEISCEDLFFDLGGHSLLSIQACNLINKYSRMPIKLRDMLTCTLAQVASLCEFKMTDLDLDRLHHEIMASKQKPTSPKVDG